MTEDEIVDDVLASMSFEDQKALLEVGAKRNLATLHHGLGTYIRNAYKLWSESVTTKRWRDDPSSHDVRDGCDFSLDHPDAVSMRVIEKLWIKLAKG